MATSQFAFVWPPVKEGVGGWAISTHPQWAIVCIQNVRIGMKMQSNHFLATYRVIISQRRDNWNDARSTSLCVGSCIHLCNGDRDNERDGPVKSAYQLLLHPQPPLAPHFSNFCRCCQNTFASDLAAVSCQPNLTTLAFSWCVCGAALCCSRPCSIIPFKVPTETKYFAKSE